jgi:ABC-type lipoprotein release transport system permease subunit
VDELFGLDMNIILYVLFAIFSLSVASIGYVVLRSRIMFMMGLRNMPRRVGQTVLIVVGLMLSTLIISAAFATGDTVDYSLTNQSFTLLGHTDQVIVRQGEEDDPPAEIDSTIPQNVNDDLRSAVEAAQDPNIDGYLPILFEQVPILSESRLSEASVTFTGLDADSMDGFPDVISSESGEVLDIGSLAADEVFLNESAADELATGPGDHVQVFVDGRQHNFTVVDVVEDRFITGVGDFAAPEGLVTRLDTLQEIFDEPGEVSAIGISNRGGVRDSLDVAEEAVTSLESILRSARLQPGSGANALSIFDVKRELVDSSEEAGNVMATFFLIFGLFSIAAGMLLIVMIFVMLAAERKPEMGMARAVGTRRDHLVQMFMSEGMAYNLLSAMVGAGLGILVAFGMAELMARIFSEFGLNIQPHVTVRTLFISYFLGVSLTYLTVVFSSWRVSNLNIVAAIRDITESKPPNPEDATVRGYLRGVLNLLVTIVVFPVGLFVLMLRGQPFGFPAAQRPEPMPRLPIWPLVPLAIGAGVALVLTLFDVSSVGVILFAIGLFITFSYLLAVLVVWLTRDRRPSDIPAWLIPAGIVIPPFGLVLVALQDRHRPIAWGAGFGTLAIGLGALLFMMGMSSDSAFPFALGFSLIMYGLAVIVRFFGTPARPVFTVAGLIVLVAWGLFAGNRLEGIVGKLEGDAEMFFLSGLAMVTASTFVLVYNADLMLAVLSRVGGAFGAILPAMRTAVAYPLADKFRTGMTMAMISLVVFALAMMSTMNLNFNKLFLADTARGGWDIVAQENPNNAIEDLAATLREEGSSAPDGFRAAGRVSFSGEAEVAEIRIGGLGWYDYPVLGVDAGFVDGGEIPLGARARGFESDEAVWEALRTRGDVAIVDGFTVGGGGLFAGEVFNIEGIDPDADVFDEITIAMLDPIDGARANVNVIGVIDFGASPSFFGVYVPQSTFSRVFGDPTLSLHFVGLTDPDESKIVAQEIEATLLQLGVQAESLKERVDDDQQLNSNFFLLMQGFMGLGLFVGIAAVGVISFRTVVERRQQIGMLRAIGYKRSTVALSFMMESSFITLLSIFSGIGLAVWLSYFLMTSNEFPSDLGGFFIPWDRLIFIGVFTWVASLLMTYIPSRQAASVPTAEALRYE